jgi:hypothetical protein
MVDARFSALAGMACALVSVLSAVGGAWAVSAVFALLAVGFAARSLDDYRRR